VRKAVSISALVVCAVAGVLTALLLAAPVASADEGTGTGTSGETTTQTTTETTDTTTTTTTTTTAPKPKPKPRPQPRLIAAGVTVGGTLVGGLTAEEARAVVAKRFARRIPLVVSPSLTISVAPADLGAGAQVRRAVDKAVGVRRRNAVVPLDVEIWEGKLRSTVRALAGRLDRKPVDAHLRLRNLAPEINPAVPGRRLRVDQNVREIKRALRTHRRDPIALDFRELPPLVADADIDTVIVIRRDSNELYFYRGETLKRKFRVATGLASYPTPIGRFEIVVKQRNPWWYPPQGSAWARGKEPVPPGPGNPLGTRWMGISSPYVGIHGTPDAASIGYSASHGCIRMLIPQVEWLFERVEVGTPVFVVRA
jgi:lipoprotein-anchoring transpeptidase ErfK/SrfK